MRRLSENRIFARNNPSDFIGRSVQLDRLMEHARSGGDKNSGLILLSAPSAGVSELMRQAYDRLFVEQDEVIPFYFEVRQSDRTAQGAALRFLCEFLLQTVAFRRRDSRIIDASPEMAEIAELAIPSDGYWIDRLVETYNGESRLGDDRAFVRNCLSAPLRAAANGARAFVMIDDLHAANYLDGGDGFFDDLRDIFTRASIPFALAGQRRFLYAKVAAESIAVDPFSFSDAGKFVENLSTKTGVAINDQTRDLIAVQFAGNAGQITSLFESAAANGKYLTSFDNVEQIYTDELFGGRIGKYFDAMFDRLIPDPNIQTRILKLLIENITAVDGKIPVSYWKRHAGLGIEELDHLLDALNYNEIVGVGSATVEFDTANTVLSDYIIGRSRLELNGESRALAVGETLSENVKRAPQLMARFYRRRSAIGVRSLMRAFDGRQVSPALLDYSIFKETHKGADDQTIIAAISDDTSKLVLPQIVYSAHTAAFYPKLNELCDAERSAVALGFSDAASKEEIAWIAVEIDSKLEATRELAEFWCDRLEMVALNCNFPHYQLWLIAPEGFSPEAMAVLHERNAIGSSRKQIDLLAGILGAAVQPVNKNAAHEYEIVIPMGEDTEMIAAHTIEEIAKRHNFPVKAINQIKTALVEACINATEHSLSPDRRIYQKFSIDTDKITLTVSNRGLRLADKPLKSDPRPDEGRRGWGLKLIQGLMDEVTVEQTDDGTRITMVKHLKAA